ncbi:MAG: CocE/NonD family hydrolase [Verrucomicrobia bacterium]|nr:CocE/NonD family hydrolase [Verrucomicrobiota bacterium]
MKSSSRQLPTPRLLATLCALLFTVTRIAAQESATAPTPVKLEFKVPMRDGVHLATDVWLPQTNGAFPVVMVRFPYNKDLGAGLGRDGCARGYAVVSQDTRGRFASEGENLPFRLDAPDGKDTLSWLLKQPWCGGQVATWGASAGAITQFQLAIDGTDPLAAQYLIVGAPNLYDVVYTGGVFRKALIEDWIRTTRYATNALAIWVGHPLYDDYWRAQDASRHYAAVNTPAIHVGGYWDIFAQATLDAFVGYQEQGGPGARGRQKLIFGPWAHAVLQDKVGDLTFPGGKNPPGNVHDAWRWFDRWLKGVANHADRDPAVTYYVLGDVTDPNAPGNTWRTADAWPPCPASPTPYYLQADRSLSTQKAAAAATLSYRHDPTHPIPTIGGGQLTLPAGPINQNPIESRDDLLVFTSEPLTEPTEVTGRVRARLWIESDAPDTDFFVRLCDVYPDGRSFNLCEGVLRARFRHGLDREQLLTPGEIQPLDIDCWSTSVIFNRGHRLRVHVSSSSAPGFDPNPNTGEPFRASDRARPARNTIHLGPDHPSHVLLPVVAAR